MDYSRAACAFVFIAHAPNGRAIRVAYLVAARRTDAHGSEAFGILDRATIDHSPPLAYVSNFYQVRSSPVRAPAVVPRASAGEGTPPQTGCAQAGHVSE